MSQAHTEVETLLTFIQDPGTLGPAEQLHIADHLTSGCPTCWAAVNSLPATEPFCPSSTTLREALIHLSCPESRAILSHDHLVALDAAQRAPTGFARLLLSEALNHCLAANEDILPGDPVVNDLVQALFQRSTRPVAKETMDLLAQNHINQTLVLLQTDQLQKAGGILMRAAALAIRGSLDPELFVNLCEAQARWAWNHSELNTAITCYRQATSFFEQELRPGRGPTCLRRFEIHGEIAILHALSGNLAEMSSAETAARRALKPLLSGADPVLATGALLRDAELTQRLAMLTPAGHVLRGRTTRRAAAALKAAARRFERFTDPLTRAQKDFCLARLHLFFARNEATVYYRRAAEGFHHCQVNSRSSGVRGEALLAWLIGDPGSEFREDLQWTRTELQGLTMALSRTSVWLSPDCDEEPN